MTRLPVRFSEIFKDRLKRHFSPLYLLRILFIGRYERREIRARHQFKAVPLGGGVVAAVMPDLIKTPCAR